MHTWFWPTLHIHHVLHTVRNMYHVLHTVRNMYHVLHTVRNMYHVLHTVHNIQQVSNVHLAALFLLNQPLSALNTFSLSLPPPSSPYTNYGQGHGREDTVGNPWFRVQVHLRSGQRTTCSPLPFSCLSRSSYCNPRTAILSVTQL